MKIKKNWVIIASSALVIFIFVLIFLVSGIINPITIVEYTKMSRSKLSDSIELKGIVESAEKRSVYTNLGYEIKTVIVEVGDKVEAGDILCQLDSEELELNIAQQKADLEVLRESSANQLENSQRLYDEAAMNLKDNSNQQILNAESSLKAAESNLKNAQKAYDDTLYDFNNKTSSFYLTAEANLISAQKNYDDVLADYSNNTDSSLLNAAANLTNAKIDLDVKKANYDNANILYASGSISKDQFTQYEAAYLSAENTYINAQKSFENAETARNRNLEQAELALNSAKLAFENAELALSRNLEQAELALISAQTTYNNALQSLNASVVLANQELNKYQSNVDNAKISTDLDAKMIAIELLEKKLADSTITAPISGTVTAVYAKEGSSGAGLMFVIEDTENLKVVTKIDEYDVVKVKPGAKAIIQLDYISNDKYDGVVSVVNPAAIKNTSGETVSSSVVEFEAEIQVLSNNSNLKIGMNADLAIIFEERENVFFVAQKALKVDQNGRNVIFIAADSGLGKLLAKQIPVTIGMKSGGYIEVGSDELIDGMKVINDASLVEDGMRVSLK